MQPYEELEEEWTRFTGEGFAVSCSSGTAALHLALLAAGVRPGDEVIVPDFTMAAVAFAVSYTGATPVFADVSLEDYSIEPHDVEKLITAKTKAVIVVHTYGRLADVGKILALCRPRGITVIEDVCEAQGAARPATGDLCCYSFYRNKIIAAEEGGMVTTHNIHFAQKMRNLKNMAFGERHDYYHESIGYNYRMPNAEATLALASLRAYPEHAAARRQVEGWYDARITEPLTKRAAVWFYEIPHTDPAGVVELIEGARLPFKPLSSFPMYGGGRGRPNARALAQMLVLLPVTPEMGEQDVATICALIDWPMSRPTPVDKKRVGALYEDLCWFFDVMSYRRSLAYLDAQPEEPDDRLTEHAASLGKGNAVPPHIIQSACEELTSAITNKLDALLQSRGKYVRDGYANYLKPVRAIRPSTHRRKRAKR